MLLDEQIVAIEARSPAPTSRMRSGARKRSATTAASGRPTNRRERLPPAAEAPRVFAVLGALGAATSDPKLAVQVGERAGAGVLEETPIDLFFAYDPLHASSMERRRRVDFYGDPIHIPRPKT